MWYNSVYTTLTKRSCAAPDVVAVTGVLWRPSAARIRRDRATDEGYRFLSAHAAERRTDQAVAGGQPAPGGDPPRSRARALPSRERERVGPLLRGRATAGWIIRPLHLHLGAIRRHQL